MTMPFIDLTAQQKRLRGEIEARLNAVLDHGGYIMGAEVAELEAAFCDRLGSNTQFPVLPVQMR